MDAHLIFQRLTHRHTFTHTHRSRSTYMYNRGGKQKGIQTFNVYFVFFLHMFFSTIYKIHKSNINVCEKDKLLVNCYSCYTMWRRNGARCMAQLCFCLYRRCFLLQPFNGELVGLLLQQWCQCVSNCRVVAIQMGFLRKMGTKISGILWVNQVVQCIFTSLVVIKSALISFVWIGHIVTVLNVSAPHSLKSFSILAGTI